MHQSQTLQSQSPHTSQNNPSGSLTLSLKVCWKDHALTQVSLRVSSNISLKSQSQVSLKKNITSHRLNCVSRPLQTYLSQKSVSSISHKSNSQVSLKGISPKMISHEYLSSYLSKYLSRAHLSDKWLTATKKLLLWQFQRACITKSCPNTDPKHCKSIPNTCRSLVEVWSKFHFWL